MKSSHCISDGSSSTAVKVQTLVTGVDSLDSGASSLAKGASR